MTWKAGQSGNPKGRPKKPHWQRAKDKRGVARSAKERAEIYVDQAFKLLGEAVMDTKAPMAARISAANSLMDRAYGRAPQDVTVKGQIEQHIIQLIQGFDTLADTSDEAENKPESVTEH